MLRSCTLPAHPPHLLTHAPDPPPPPPPPPPPNLAPRAARTLPTAPHPASPTLPAVTPATVVDRDVDVRREATEDAAPPTGAAQLLDKAFRFHPPGRQWAPNKPLGRAVAGEPKATRPLPATAAEAQLSRAKLRELLDSFGEYPERYR